MLRVGAMAGALLLAGAVSGCGSETSGSAVLGDPGVATGSPTSEPTSDPTSEPTEEPTAPTPPAGPGEFAFDFPDELAGYERQEDATTSADQATPDKLAQAIYTKPGAPADLFLVQGDPFASSAEAYQAAFDDAEQIDDAYCGTSGNLLCAVDYKGGVLSINGSKETFPTYADVVAMIDEFRAVVPE